MDATRRFRSNSVLWLLAAAACGDPAPDSGMSASVSGGPSSTAAPSVQAPASGQAGAGAMTAPPKTMTTKPAATGGATAAAAAGGAPAAGNSAGGAAGVVAAAGAAGAGTTSASAGTTGGQAGMSAAAGSSAGAAGMSAAGSGGAMATGMGGFPRTAEEINVKSKGPYTVKSYSDGLMAREYSSSVMYYPDNATPPFAAVALAPGFTASGTDYEFVGDMLASHGIAVLLTTPTDTDVDQPPARGDDLVAAVKHLQEENDRQGSPLQGKLATDRICVTGQSMGGGGSLFAANALGNKIRCAMPLEPWQPGGSFPMITAPTLIIGAASDTIADVPSHAAVHYASIPDSTEKFLVVFEGDHYLSTDRTSGIAQGMPAVANENYDIQAAYMVPFYKLFLEGDERYRPYLYGAMRSMQSVTRYEKSKM